MNASNQSMDLKLNLIKRKSSLYGNAPCFDVMKEFEITIYNEHHTLRHINNNYPFWPLLHKLINTRLDIPIPKFLSTKKNLESYFSIQMGPDFGKILPYCYISKNTYAYFFDIWPKFFDETEKFIVNSSINHVFLSSLYATNYFKGKGIKNVTWIPEGVFSKEYKYLPYSQKDIDVLELGRKHQSVHANIVDILSINTRNHVYEKIPGKSIFSGKRNFITGLARSKISLCFPKSETHPEIAGQINTMTNRYLQSMASKCLVVGSAPEEMNYLFDYPAVVQLDKRHPGEHLLEILNHYKDYEELIEKNYLTVKKNHNWHNRWEEIIKIITLNNYFN